VRLIIIVHQLGNPLYTWGGWSRILHLLHTTSSWPIINCAHKECRTGLVRVQMNYSAPLERTAFDQARSVAVWHMKRFICHSWWQWWVCVYTSPVVQLKCSVFRILLSFLDLFSIFLGRDVLPLPQVPGFWLNKIPNSVHE